MSFKNHYPFIGKCVPSPPTVLPDSMQLDEDASLVLVERGSVLCFCFLHTRQAGGDRELELERMGKWVRNNGRKRERKKTRETC